jgi:hypothetical protein
MTNQPQLPHWILIEYQALAKDLAQIHERLRNLTDKAIEDAGTTLMDRVRAAARDFGKNGRTFTSGMISNSIGIHDPDKRGVVASYLSRLVRRPNSGITKIGTGYKGRYKCE